MSQSASDPTRRIPKSIGTDTKLFGTYTLSDLAVGIFPGVVVVLCLQIVIPSLSDALAESVRTLTLPLAALAISVGVLFVYLTPPHMTSLDWVQAFIGFYRRPKHYPHQEARAQTGVEAVYPEYDAIERSDGAYLGFVQVVPPTMALATNEEWHTKADGFREFLNTAVEFPIQLHSTTQEFPVEEYLSHYEARLTDPDVQANPRLEALIREYIEWYRADLESRQTSIRDHYVVVPVRPRDVRFDHESLLEKLTSIPILGLFIRVWLAPSLAEQETAMTETVAERRQRVITGLRGIEGCHAEAVAAEDAAMLVAEFWQGDSLAYDAMDRTLDRGPLVREEGDQ